MKKATRANNVGASGACPACIADVVKLYGWPYICRGCGAWKIVLHERETLCCPTHLCSGILIQAGPRQKFTVGIHDTAQRIRQENKRG